MNTEKRHDLVTMSRYHVRSAMRHLDTTNNSYKAYVELDKAADALSSLDADLRLALNAQKEKNNEKQ